MQIDRRKFLKGSVASLAAALASRSTGAASNGRPAKNVIVVACFGGWDAASVLDPKLEKNGVALMPGEETSIGNIDYRTLDTTKTVYEKAGDQVQAFFEEHYEKMVVLRGINVGSLAHAACRVRILTGTDDATLPDFAAIAASEIGYDRPLPYVDLGGNGYMGPLGRIVGRFGVDSQISALVDPTNKKYAEYTPVGSPLYVPGNEDEDAIANYVLGRAQEQLGGRAKLGYNNDRVRDFIESHARASSLYDHRSQLPYAGKFTELLDQVRLVPALLEGDALCRTIFLDSRLPWDTHFDNDNLQLICYQTAFGALRELLAGIEALDDTLVVVLSEMGRTPRLNTAESPGKDHWPTTTALLFGGGLRGDRVLGATDVLMNALPMNFATGAIDETNGDIVTHTDFLATILDYVGVEPAGWLPEGRVITALADA